MVTLLLIGWPTCILVAVLFFSLVVLARIRMSRPAVSVPLTVASLVASSIATAKLIPMTA